MNYPVYVFSQSKNKVYEITNDIDLEITMLQYPDDIIVTKDEAYAKLFMRISKAMNSKFSNYRHLDIGAECLCMMFNRYRIKGIFAPDKPYVDNERMWWKYAKQSCLYLIRKYKKDPFNNNRDTWDIEDNESDTSLKVGRWDDHAQEHTDACNEILAEVNKLMTSTRYYEQQLGLFAKCKIEGLTNEQTCEILEIGMPRLYEIQRELKEYFHYKFGGI